MEITLHNITHNLRLSQETNAFTADVWINGKKAGTAENAGHGGETCVYLHPKELQQEAEAYARSLPPLDLGEGTLIPTTLDMLVDDLLTQHLHNNAVAKQKKRWCKKHVVYRVKGDPEDEYRTMQLDNGAFTDRQRKYLIDKYGDQLVEIVNDTLVP